MDTFLIITASALIAITLVVLLIIGQLMRKSFSGHSELPKYSHAYRYDHYADKYPRRKVVYSNSKAELYGFIFGEENTKALIVVSHGIGCYHEDYLSSITWFVDHGYRVFAPDYSGSGNSGGNITGLPQSVIDLDAALSYIEADPELSSMPKVLFGHSWGAYAVAAVLNKKHDLKAAVTIAGFNDPSHQLTEVFKMLNGNIGTMLYPFVWVNHVVMFGPVGYYTAERGINRSSIPVLIVQGKDDPINAMDGTSIYAVRSKITNPSATYLYLTKEGCCSHDSPFHTEHGNKCLDMLLAKIKRLHEIYNDAIPDDEMTQIYDSLDRDAINEPNDEFLSKVDEFYRNAMKWS